MIKKPKYRTLTLKRKRNPSTKELKFKTEHANKKLDYFWQLWLEELPKIFKDPKWRFELPENHSDFILNAVDRQPIFKFKKENGKLLLLGYSDILNWQGRIISLGQKARLTHDEIDSLIEYLTGMPIKD